MTDHIIKKLANNTIEVTIDIAWNEIKSHYDKAFDRLLNKFSYTGFRKGKVPKSIAEKQIKKETVYQELLKNLLPSLYQSIIEKENLKPVVSPKIELLSGNDNEDWKFKISIAERPEIILGQYKKAIKDLNEKLKKPEIWVPGKDKQTENKSNNNKINKNINEILSLLIKVVICKLSDLIIEEQLNQRLARLVDEIQKIGLTVDQYLKSTNITIEQLKNRLKDEISTTYKIEYILLEIADKERITVDNTDLEKLFSNIKDDKEKADAKANSYLYASILRKQKTIDFLTSL
jgi:trigger factor